MKRAIALSVALALATPAPPAHASEASRDGAIVGTIGVLGIASLVLLTVNGDRARARRCRRHPERPACRAREATDDHDKGADKMFVTVITGASTSPQPTIGVGLVATGFTVPPGLAQWTPAIITTGLNAAVPDALFTHAADGQVTYTGTVPAVLELTAMMRVGGPVSTNLRATYAVNGFVGALPAAGFVTDAGGQGPMITISGLILAQPGDVFQLFLMNIDNLNQLIVGDFSWSIFGIQ